MRIKVYKSLDKPSSFLGLKGSYIMYTGVGAVIALCLAGYISTLTNGLIGILSFLGLCVIIYLMVLRVQASMTERELKRFLSGKMLPNYIVFHPERLKKYLRERTED